MYHVLKDTFFIKVKPLKRIGMRELGLAKKPSQYHMLTFLSDTQIDLIDNQTIPVLKRKSYSVDTVIGKCLNISNDSLSINGRTVFLIDKDSRRKFNICA